jgi:hypothetical protein
MGAITRGIANNILGSGAVDGTDALTGTIPATNIGNPSLANLTTFPPSVDTGSIPQVAGDPPSPSDGDVWYNSNTYKLRVRGVSAAAGSWATGGSMNTARKGKLGGAGTQTASLGFGGNLAPGFQTLTESYNGSSWTEVNDLNTAKTNMGDVGTQTSALSAGGYLGPPGYTAETESWNGTSWTEVNDLNTARYVLAGAGVDNTSALVFGGYTTGQVVVTESWNGTSWTEVNDLNSARWSLGGAGTQTSALAFGGYDNPIGQEAGYTEVWNGSSWTEVADMNTARRPGGTGATNTAVLAYGGPSDTGGANTESWDGSSWTEVGDLSTARNGLGSSGTTLSALAFGGEDPALPGKTAATEEWNAGAGNLNVDLA